MLLKLVHLILPTLLRNNQSRYYYFHFIDEKLRLKEYTAAEAKLHSQCSFFSTIVQCILLEKDVGAQVFGSRNIPSQESQSLLLKIFPLENAKNTNKKVKSLEYSLEYYVSN